MRGGESKYQHSLLGPASAPIDIKSFLRQAVELETVQDASLTATNYTRLNDTDKAVVHQRCSVSDFKDELKEYFQDDGFLADLKLWQWARTFSGNDDQDVLNAALAKYGATPSRRRDPDDAEDGSASTSTKVKGKGRKRKADEVADEASANSNEILIEALDPALQPDTALSPEREADESEGASTSNKPATKKKKRTPTATVKLAMSSSIEEVKKKLTGSSMRSYSPIYGGHHMRKTRQSDYQSLSHLRTPFIKKFTEYESTDAALQEFSHDKDSPDVLISVTFHPIPIKVTSQEKKDSFNILSRLQKTVFLGSQTLADVRDALVSAPRAVPRLKSETENMQQLLSQDFNDSTLINSEQKYANERWEGGAVMAIDGKLYPDTRGGRPDYSELLLRLIRTAPHEWPSNRVDMSLATNATLLHNDIILNLNPYSAQDEIDPSLMGNQNASAAAELHDSTQLPRASRPFAPSYTYSGSTMQDTKLADLVYGLRLGEPYWLLQQGCDEHVFSFDEIRLMHPTDPAAKIPNVTPQPSPYPITTFLSRINVSKCMVCERDPATKTVIRCELAGISPCPMCDSCLDYLHGSEEAAKAAGVEIIPLLEEL